jgi:putative acetyltransferase
MPDTASVIIDELRTPADADAFRTLNEAWITRFFTLEDADRAILGDPAGRIIEPGGAVFVARLGDEVVGCVGIAPEGERVFELVKMAVCSSVRRSTGRGRSERSGSPSRRTPRSPAPCTCTRRRASGT